MNEEVASAFDDIKSKSKKIRDLEDVIRDLRKQYDLLEKEQDENNYNKGNVNETELIQLQKEMKEQVKTNNRLQ